MATAIDTAKSAIFELEQNAEKMKNDSERVFGTEWSVGDCSAQGDVNLICIKKMPKSAKIRHNRQLAEGNSMGSRHILIKGECYDADTAEVAALVKEATGGKLDIASNYIGCVFKGPAVLEHPEHGNQVWEGNCINAVVFQRVLDAELKEQRARD
jgi:hypothetical protein